MPIRRIGCWRLSAIYDGVSRSRPAEIGGVGLQTVRNWVLRFNAHGPDGLLDGKAPGRSGLAESYYDILAHRCNACRKLIDQPWHIMPSEDGNGRMDSDQ